MLARLGLKLSIFRNCKPLGRASWISVRLIDLRIDALKSAFREKAASPSIMGKCKCMVILRPLCYLIWSYIYKKGFD